MDHSVHERYSSVYQIPIRSISGEENFLSSFEGKVGLFINIATKAGYEPKCSKVWSYARTARRLWELQQLHDMFDNFNVIGFPCNQFYGMEPTMDNKKIIEFIKTAYPFVSFPISEVIDVNGENEHPVYTFLKGRETRRSDDTSADGSAFATESRNKANDALARIPNNYESLVIGQHGRVVYRFGFRNWPLDKESVTNESDMTILSAVSSLTA
jgi:glutathione peroxidase